jgi:hypothetical protein
MCSDRPAYMDNSDSTGSFSYEGKENCHGDWEGNAKLGGLEQEEGGNDHAGTVGVEGPAEDSDETWLPSGLLDTRSFSANQRGCGLFFSCGIGG